MNADLERVVARFPNAVLSGVDDAGWPASVRCRPRYDRGRAALRCDRAPGVEIVEGRASLLWHAHDDGELEQHVLLRGLGVTIERTQRPG